MLQKTVPETHAMLAGHQQQLRDTGAIGLEELAALKAQQRILAVDLAGARAQLEAAAKLLFNRNRLSPSRIEQLECIKTETEIELARLGGRQRILDSLIAAAQQQRSGDLRVGQPQLAQDPLPSSDFTAPAASQEPGSELLDYCEALCAGDLKIDPPEELPQAPLSRDQRGASPLAPSWTAPR